MIEIKQLRSSLLHSPPGVNRNVRPRLRQRFESLAVLA